MATGVCRKNYTAVFLPVCMLFALGTQAMQKKQKTFYRKVLLKFIKSLEASAARVLLKDG